MTQTVPQTTQASFGDEVLTSDRPVLVDFYADWCAPCRAIAPVVEALSTELGDSLSVVKVDVDRNQKLAETYDIRGIPTLMLFKSGKPVETVVGATSRDQLANAIKPHL